MSALPILMYHSVDASVDARYTRWSVSPGQFERHMSVLADGGYTVLTAGSLIDRLNAGDPLPERCVVLTFDDGLRDFLTGAMPVLQRFGFGATLYVVAGLVGQSARWLAPLGEGGRPMLSAAELRDLDAAGIEIGAHSMTHPQLDILRRSEADREIRSSRRILEDMIGKPVRSFAYPHGFASRVTRRIVRDAGFSSAVRVRHALSSATEDRFGLSRLIVTAEYDEKGLSALLGGSGVPVTPPLDRPISDWFRTARRVRRWADQLLPAHATS